MTGRFGAVIRRYRRALLLALPVSIGLGALAGVALLASDGFRATTADSVWTVEQGAATAFATGLAGMIGAVLALVIPRRAEAGSARRAATGAGTAILTLWWAAAIVYGVTAPNYGIFAVVIAAAGLVAAILGALVAAALVAADERRASRRPAESPGTDAL